MVFGYFLSRIPINMNFVNHVDLVTYQNQLSSCISILLNSIQPVVYIDKRLHFRNIKYKYDSNCATIVLQSWLSKSVLSSCVPYLNFHRLIHVFYVLHDMINSRCANQTLREFSFRKSVHQATFPDSGVTQNEQF